MLLFFVVIIGIFIFAAMTSNSSSSTPSPSPAQPTPPPVKRFDENDPYDICCALACLAAAVPYCQPGSYGYLIVTISNEEHFTNIHVSFNGFNYKNKAAYDSLWISETIADYLTSVPFNITESGALEIRFNYCIDPDRAMRTIREGMGMAKCPSDRCELESIHPKNNPMITMIHFISDM